MNLQKEITALKNDLNTENRSANMSTDDLAKWVKILAQLEVLVDFGAKHFTKNGKFRFPGLLKWWRLHRKCKKVAEQINKSFKDQK